MRNRRKLIRDGAALAAFTAMPISWSEVLQTQQQLPRRNIPGTDDSLSVIGLGNSNAFRQNDIAGSTALIKLFSESGGNYIDCAGSSRAVVSNAARSLDVQENIFLGMYFSGNDEATLRGDAENLLRISGKQKLDLAHAYIEFAEANWNVFQQWKDEGLARHIGIARFGERYFDSMMRMMQTGSVDVLQVNYSLFETQAENRVLPMALDKGVAVTINRPFINGAFFSRIRGRELPAWATEFDCHSWAQFSLKFILSHPAVTCVLTETANPKHALDNIGAGFGSLPDEKTRRRMLQYVKDL
jgi:diketogulonate reductase-like aldo/keto reductase